jgi:hypothetical protein
MKLSISCGGCYRNAVQRRAEQRMIGATNVVILSEAKDPYVRHTFSVE